MMDLLHTAIKLYRALEATKPLMREQLTVDLLDAILGQARPVIDQYCEWEEHSKADQGQIH